jgi:hypothetical protein
VFGIHELNFFVREHHPGELVEAAWIRNGTVMRGTAELGPRTLTASTAHG